LALLIQLPRPDRHHRRAKSGRIGHETGKSRGAKVLNVKDLKSLTDTLATLGK
jgi:hypothetical protein